LSPHIFRVEIMIFNQVQGQFEESSAEPYGPVANLLLTTECPRLIPLSNFTVRLERTDDVAHVVVEWRQAKGVVARAKLLGADGDGAAATRMYDTTRTLGDDNR
jgi:hypothetical protein